MGAAQLEELKAATLHVLEHTGIHFPSERALRVLSEHGAQVDAECNMVRMSPGLVLEAMSHAPRSYKLSGRSAGTDLHLGGSASYFGTDGCGTRTVDLESGVERRSCKGDMAMMARVSDYLSSVAFYWPMVSAQDYGLLAPLHELDASFRNTSKHVQTETVMGENPARYAVRMAEVISGDRDRLREEPPLSVLICTIAPLGQDPEGIEAGMVYAESGIPVAVMPMPLMGGTAPASPLATTITGNCEVLATLCLVQAAVPGTPFIYAPVLAVIDPRSGRYSAGAIEGAVLGAASTEMARYYGLPVETSGGGTDHHVPSIQGGYERAMGALLPLLSWPDILVGPGCLGSSMVFSPEQLVIDMEIYRMGRQAQRGIVSSEVNWLDDLLENIQPGDHFLDQISTVKAIRGGEWHISDLGVHDTYERWVDAGRPTLLEGARERVRKILATHQPLPLGEEVEGALEQLRLRAEA